MGSHFPLVRPSWAVSGMFTAKLSLPKCTLRLATSMVISSLGSASTAAASAWICAVVAVTQGMPNVVQDLRKALRDHSPQTEAIQRLRSMLPGAAAAEVDAGKQHLGVSIAWIVQWMFCHDAIVWPMPHIVKKVLAQAVEGDAFHETRGDDAVRIDV
jgi:hypothetical protein